MILLKEVEGTKVKRAFVAAQKMRFSRKKGKKYLPKLEKLDFLRKLTRAKRDAGKLNEKQLDKIIAGEWAKRTNAYNNSEWCLARASVKELGVWRRAGGLPPGWTCCALDKTAFLFKKGLINGSRLIRARSKRAIPRIVEFADIIEKEKCLFPIVFMNRTGTCGRSWCRTKVKGDIDDGCMRSIALAMSGRKELNIYFGKPK
ncbi:MAG: hypothetical protein V1856_03590 [Candidatus Liptonbacteria bacterium]